MPKIIDDSLNIAHKIAPSFPAFIPFIFPSIKNVACVFSTAIAGNLSLDTAKGEEQREQVVAQRAKIVQSYDLAHWVECKQVHGDMILLDAEPNAWQNSPTREADGLSTSATNTALVIKTADCQPVLLAHVSGKYIAALHVGWRGNTLDFVASAVDKFCHHYGVLARDVLAVRGPSLGSPVAEFVNFSQEWPEKFSPWYSPANKMLDLWGLTRQQLELAGLASQHIFGLDLCTYSLSPAFFSHRKGQAGRQLSLIWRR